MWVRGLKLNSSVTMSRTSLSHPMWVRGLKLCVVDVLVFDLQGRTPCGCVD